MFLPLTIQSKGSNIASPSYLGQNLTERVKSWAECIMTNDTPQCPIGDLAEGTIRTLAHVIGISKSACVAEALQVLATRDRRGLITQISTAAEGPCI